MAVPSFGIPGIAGEDLEIGQVLCYDERKRYVVAATNGSERCMGVAPRDIAFGELFRPVTGVAPPGIVISI